jgi:hypothetical protein
MSAASRIGRGTFIEYFFIARHDREAGVKLSKSAKIRSEASFLELVGNTSTLISPLDRHESSCPHIALGVMLLFGECRITWRRDGYWAASTV